MAKNSSRFVYRGGNRTVETVVRKSKQAGGLYDSPFKPDVTTYKPKEGECTVRILPGTWEDTDAWGDGWDITTWIHYSIGADDGAYLCLDKMKGESCPICEARREATGEEADDLKPSMRPLCWVIDRDNEKAGPQLWSLPNTLFREINLRSVDKKSNAALLIDHPDEGYDIAFTRTGTGLTTNYSGVEVLREQCPIHDDPKKQDAWMAYIVDNPLPDTLNFYDAEYIEKVLFGKADRRKVETDEDEDEDEGTSRRGSRRATKEDKSPPARRPRNAPPPEEDDDKDDAPPPRSRRGAAKQEEDEDPPFDVDEDDPPPRGKTASRRAPSPDDDEEEDGDEDDDTSDSKKGSAVTAARRSLERLKNGRR